MDLTLERAEEEGVRERLDFDRGRSGMPKSAPIIRAASAAACNSTVLLPSVPLPRPRRTEDDAGFAGSAEASPCAELKWPKFA